MRDPARTVLHGNDLWRSGIGGKVAGCSAVELPTEGELKATRGEAGFHIGVVD